MRSWAKNISAVLLIMSFVSCDNRIDIPPQFELYQAILGPEGGIIEFYENGFPGESVGFSSESRSKKLLARLDVPEGALTEETRFTIQKRNFNVDSDLISDEVIQIGPLDVNFLKPATLSISYESDTVINDFYCFANVISLPVDADLINNIAQPEAWTSVENATIDEEEKLITVSVNNLNELYSVGINENEKDFYFCRESNNILEIDLIQGSSVMVLREGALPTPSYLEKQPFFIPTPNDRILPFIDGYYLLQGEFGGLPYQVLPANQRLLNDNSLIFIEATPEQAGDVYLNWEKALPNLQIVRIDPQSNQILETIPYDRILSFESRYVFGSEITHTGAYALAVPEADFELWMGGSLTAQVSGAGIDTTLVYENYDFGGGNRNIFGEMFIQLNRNPGKDQSGGFVFMRIDDAAEGTFFYPGIFDSFLLDYQDVNGDYERIRYEPSQGVLTVTRFDGPGGWIEGTITNREAGSAYLSDNTPVDLSVSFRFRISTWDEL